MHTVTGEIDVSLPISTVYNQWTQFEDFPAFMSGVEEVTQLDDTHTHWKVRVKGVEREYDAEITEQVPDQRIAWASTSGPQQSGVVTFRRVDEQLTRVRLALDWDPEGFVEKLGAALNIDEAQVNNDLRKFAEIIEANGFATGAWRGKVQGGTATDSGNAMSGAAATTGMGDTGASPMGSEAVGSSMGRGPESDAREGVDGTADMPMRDTASDMDRPDGDEVPVSPMPGTQEEDLLDLDLGSESERPDGDGPSRAHGTERPIKGLEL